MEIERKISLTYEEEAANIYGECGDGSSTLGDIF